MVYTKNISALWKLKVTIFYRVEKPDHSLKIFCGRSHAVVCEDGMVSEVDRAVDQSTDVGRWRGVAEGCVVVVVA